MDIKVDRTPFSAERRYVLNPDVSDSRPGYKGKDKNRKTGKGLRNYDNPTFVVRKSGYWPSYGTTSYGIARTTISQVISKNNGKARPWSDFSYRKLNVLGDLSGTKSWNDLWHYEVIPPWLEDREGAADTNWSSNNWFGTSYAISDVSASTDAIALAKLHATLKDSRAQMQLAVTLAEGRSTARMIGSTASRIYNSARCLRKGNLMEAWSHVMGRSAVPKQHRRAHAGIESRIQRGRFHSDEDFARNWLEFNYGWRPLLNDVDSAAKYLAEKHVQKKFQVYPVRRQHKDQPKGQYTEQKLVGSNAGGHWLYTWENVERCTYTYELYPDFLRKPSTLGELGFLDPLTVAWELVPYSFVADWFVNVGQILESLYEFNQWKVARGLRSTKVGYPRTRISLSSPKVYNSGQMLRSVGGSFQKMEYFHYRRKVLSSLPLSVPLRVKIANPFDLKTGQFATSIALLIQQFHGRTSTTFRR